MKIFDVLEEYYRGDVSAPSSARALGPLEDPLLIPDAIGEHSEALANLFRWYGIVSDGNIHLDRRFSVAFGIDEPGTTDDLPEIIEANDGILTAPMAGDITGPSTGTSGPEPPKPRPDTGKSPVEKKIDELVRKVGPWKEYPDQNYETGNYLKRGLRDALERLTDGFALFEGTRLKYQLSSQKEPFVLTNTTKTPSSFQIDLDPEEFRDSDLRNLLKFGIRRDMDPTSADYNAVLESYATQLTGYAKQWRRQLREGNLHSDDVLYKGHTSFDFIDFVLATYSLIVAFDSPTQPLSAEALNERFDKDTDYVIDEAVYEWCLDNLDPDEYQSISDVMDHAEYLKELMGELLGVSSSNLDMRRVRKRLEENSPYEVLSMLGRGYIHNIDTSVEFNNGPNLKVVAHTAYDLRKAIDEINDFGPDEDAIDTVLTEIQGLDMSDISGIIDNLELYDEVNSEVLESLKRFKELPQEDIDEAVAIAKRANELRGETANEREELQAILMGVHLKHTDTYQSYNNIILEPTDDVSGLGQSFQGVAQHYVE
jgi:hypothetical protein